MLIHPSSTRPRARNARRHGIFSILAGLALAACTSTPVAPPQVPAPRPVKPIEPAPAYSPAVQKLVDEANALAPLAASKLSSQFLAATKSLPEVAPRTAYRNDNTREYFSSATYAAMNENQRARLTPQTLDEFRYYNTKYGSPLAYMRLLDLVAVQGMDGVAGKRILDFGYGSIGHLRLLASLGAHVTGVDVDSYLDALYADPQDQGSIAPARGLYRGEPGSITLAHGHYPKDARIAAKVGAGYDLILSKNTLKRGYIKPERRVDKRLLVDLGVPDDAFLKSLHGALNTGGKLLIYNLYPKPSAPNEAYKPWSDGRSPFTREQYEKAGFRVIALDAEDHAVARRMGRALKWDQNEKGETIDDLETNLFALYTLLEKR